MIIIITKHEKTISEKVNTEKVNVEKQKCQL